MSEQNTVDATDKEILAQLQVDASITNADLAVKVGLSPSACLGRVRKLKESGLIDAMVAKINRKNVGLATQTLVFVSLSPHDRETTEKFLDAIREVPRILECHTISGKFDYLLKVVSPEIQEYRDFVIDELIEIPGVGKVESMVVLSTEKETTCLPLDDAKAWK